MSHAGLIHPGGPVSISLARIGNALTTTERAHMLGYSLSRNPYLRAIWQTRRGRKLVFTEFNIEFSPRWNGPLGNPHLAPLIASHRNTYISILGEIASCEPIIGQVLDGSLGRTINWRNGFIPALDGLSIMWAALQAGETFMEVGSGTSTLFARSALAAEQRSTKLVSIDPMPRVEVDAACDEIYRSPLEKMDLSVFDRLRSGDVLFVDNSHQSFMNSDVTTFMLDVVPRLASGVLIGIHDIFLPYDYPAHWSDRCYNEQYLLACYLLSNPDFFDIKLANNWISRQQLHHDLLARIWGVLGEDIRNRHSSAFWVVKE